MRLKVTRGDTFERQASEFLSIINSEKRSVLANSAKEIEKKYSDTSLFKDSFPDLVTFPEDDISVEQVSKISRNVAPSITEEIAKAAMGTPIENHIKVYNCEFLVIRKKYSTIRGPGIVLPSNAGNEPFPDNEWPENPMGDPEKESKMYLNVAILRGYKPEDSLRDAELRQNSNRDPIFNTFPFQRNQLEKALDTREVGEQFVHHRKLTYLQVQCEKLQFSLGELEPLFCEAALYDISKKRKVSESWSFNTNSDTMLSMLGSRIVKKIETSSKTSLFCIPNPSPDIYLLVRVQKPLRGVELDAAVEPYTKEQLKQKDRQKLAKDVAQSMIRLGEFEQPLAWGAIQLFNEGGQLLVGDLTQIKLNRARADETETQILEIMRKRHGKDKKISSLPCDFVFNFKVIDEKQRKQIKELIDPSYLGVNAPVVEIPAVREMQDLTEYENVTAPTLEYINNLYIYPEQVNFTKSKDSNRNICVTVMFKESDADINDQGMNIIYGKSSGAAFRPGARTAVIYHKKNPAFYEEVKVRVPPVLTQHHHIIFKFTHVNCQSKGKNQDQVETLIGYAAIPFFLDGKILEDSTFNVPIASVIVPGYLSPDAESNLKWIDSKKPIFTFSTKLCSTIFSQDGNLNDFFKQFYAGSNTKQLSMALRKLQVVENESFAQYYPVILNILFIVLCTRTDSCVREAFEAILVTLEKVALLPNPPTSDLIQFYVNYVFENPSSVTTQPFFMLASQFSDMVSVGISSNNDEWLLRVVKQAQTLFSMIIKSMTLFLYKRKLLNKSRVDVFTKEYEEVLEELVRGLASVVATHANVQNNLNRFLSLFLVDLFSLMDRGFVLPLVGSYISRLDNSNQVQTLVTAKFKALKILCSYEHFVPLNLPLTTPLNSVMTIMEDFWKKHYLVGVLLDEISSCLSSPEGSNRLKAITTFRDILWKLATTEYLNEHPEKMKRVVSMFFPFLFIALERVEQLSVADKKEKREWSICVLFILAHCDREKLLYRWWKMDTLKHHIGFVQLLAECIEPIEDVRLLRESSFIVLETLEEFMTHMERDLAAEDGPLFQNFFMVIVQLLKMRQTVSFLSSMFLTLRRFIVKFARILFTGDNTSYCESLCYHILRYTNVAHAVTRSEAGSLLYMMIKSNIQQRKNFSRTKLQSTIAISRLCGGEHLNNSDDFSSLQKTLDYVAKLANKEYSKIPHFEHIGGEVLQLVQRLFQVIQDSLKIDKYKNDPEMVADLTYQVSLGYKESPDLRLTWIENLVSCHKKSANFEEVAQCKFLIAGLIIESLRSRLESQQTGLPLSKEEIVSFCPNMPTEPGHPSGKDSTDENLFTSVQFSERGLIDVLLQTTDILRACQRFETCVEMFNVLLEYYQTKKDYKNLSVCFDELKEVCVSLVSTDKNEGRLFNNYYRVCFYGQLFEETNGKEMIYKEAATVRVAEFTERLKSNFSHLGPLTVLPNSPADTETLKNDTTKIYIQIIAVNPYFEDEHSRKTEWDRNFNICDFIYETPFTSTGKAHGDLSVQCKRKTIVTTEKKFPYVKKRLLVVSRKEIILQPLQNAIEIIQNRVKALRRELQLSPPNPKTLQIQLQGAVLAQVNAGPIEIAKTFLGPSAQRYIDADPTNGPADITSLGSSLSEFLVVCQFALKLNVGLIEADQIPFQKQCETSFAELQQQINDILKATPGFNQ